MGVPQALLETAPASRRHPPNGSKASLRDQRWDRRLEELLAFKTEHGHCDVPGNYPANPSLTFWVHNCRRMKKLGQLAPQRVQQLETIGFSWNVRKRRFVARDWDAMVAKLAAFKARHHHCNVPQACPDDPELAAWLHGVRCNKRAGRLDPDRIRQLDELGVEWDRGEARWWTMFGMLFQYKLKHCDCNVPGNWTGNPELGTWVKALRASRKNNRLSEERIRQLDQLGFEWERTGDPRWEGMYEQLAAFQREHGHCRVSTISKEHRKLGNWVRTLRMRRKKGDLSPEQIGRLDALGFTWDLWREQWESKFAALVKFKSMFGHCNVSQSWAYDRALGNWVVTQRLYYKKGLLDAQQIERLTALGFQFSLAPDRLILTPAAKLQAASRPDRRRAA